MIDFAVFTISAILCLVYLIRRGIRTRKWARFQKALLFGLGSLQTDEYGRIYRTARRSKFREVQ